MAEDFAIGRALVIPKDVLSNLDKVDEKINKIATDSENMATKFTAAMSKMSVSTGDLIQKLQSIHGLVGSIGNINIKGLDTASTSMSKTATEAERTANNVTKAATAINKMSNTDVSSTLSKMTAELSKLNEDIKLYYGYIGTGKKTYIEFGQQELKTATARAEELMRAISALDEAQKRLNKSGNVFSDYIDDLNGASLSAQRQANEMKKLNQYYKELEQTSAKKAKEDEKAAERAAKAAEKEANAVQRAAEREAKAIASAEEKKRKELQKSYEAQAKLDSKLRKSNYQSYVTSTEGSLRTAGKANTYAQRAQAIKNLEEAIKKLRTTDANYQKDLQRLSDAHKRLSNEQKKVEANFKSIKSSQRSLMNTSDQLTRKLALIFSVSQIEGYIMKLVKVRGEFELQNTALASILQNKDQADKLFGQITELAVKSPFTVKELTTYTKSLSAYSVEYEKLYDTTKMLADVSAGLGVDMQRLILAFGQVKAANFLRGCLGYDTPVMLFDGTIKNVQDIEVGDVLINENGDAVNVLELIRGRETMYLVEQVSGHNRTSYRVNRNHILTLWNVPDQKLEDIYVYDYLKKKDYGYLGYKIIDGQEVFYDIEVTKDRIDDYYGFVLDGNKRFRLGDGTVTHNTETRQFTEAGINMLGELAKYYTELEGRIVSVAEVQERQFKRMISFADVEEVFKRLTSAGGMFYNMQERQAETLAGMMSNLKDSIDLMFNSMGESNEFVLKGIVNTLKTIVENWEILANIIKTSAVGFTLYVASVTKAAIANKAFAASNIEATISAGGLNKATAKIITSMKSLAAFAKANPFVLIASAVTLATLSILDHYKKVEKAKEEYDILTRSLDATKKEVENIKNSITENNRIIEENSKKVSSLSSNTDEYKKVQEELNKAQKSQSSILEELRTKFPEIYNGLVKQKDGTIDMTEAQKAYNEELERTRTLNFIMQDQESFFGDGIFEDFRDLEEAQNDYTKATNKAQDVYNATILRLEKLSATSESFAKKYKSSIEQIQKSNDSYENKLKRLRDLAPSTIFNEGYFAFSDITTALYGFSDAFTVYSDKANDANKQIDKLIENALATIGVYSEDAFKGLEDSSKQSAKRIIENFVNTIPNIKNEFIQQFVNERLNLKLGFTLDFNKETPKELSDWQKRINKYIEDNNLEIKPILATDTVDSYFGNLRDKLSELEKEQKKLQNATEQRGESGLSNKEQLKSINNEISMIEKLLIAYDELYGKEHKKGKEDNTELKRLKDQIALIKKAGEEYEKLTKYYSEEEATSKIRESFADAFSNLGLDITMDFDTTGIIKGLESLYKSVGSEGKKILDETLAPLKSQQEIDIRVKGLNEIQKQLDEVFAGYELSVELEKMGLDNNLIGQLFNVDTFSLDDVKKNLDKMKPELVAYGKDGIDIFNNMEKKITEMQQSELQERLKSYAQYLKKSVSERVAIEMEAQKKIEEVRGTKEFTPEQQNTIIKNIKVEKQEKLDKLSWEDFQGTDEYIQLFEDLEYVSTSAINKMLSDLEGLRDSLKHLPPEDLKEIVQQMERLKEIKIQRNPFKYLFSDDVKDASKAWNELGSILNDVSSAASNIASSLENVFGTMDDKTADVVSSFSEIASGVGNAASGVSRIMAGDIIGGGIQALQGIASTIGAIFNIGDKKKEREIQRQLELIENLQRSYEKLEKAIEDAYSIDTYKEANEQAIANLEDQNEALQSAINAERDKKKTDNDRIKEWEEQYQENLEKIQELNEEFLEGLGGFGSAENIKSAAQEFADAWLDAYLETGDGLDALNEKWDEFIKNVVAKQLMLKGTEKFLEPAMNMLDEMLADGEFSPEEAKKLEEYISKLSPELNEYWKSIMEGLNIEPNIGDTMSSLQRGIEGITAEQSDALESLLNSVRFFTSDSNAVLHNIYNAITIPNVENPFLAELKVQSEQLRLLYGLFNGIIKNVSGSGKAMSVRIV